jgi:hypothetical protein
MRGNWKLKISLRRYRLGLFIGVLFTLVLAGCDAPRADTLRITGWISTPVEETLMRSMIDAFERRHPGSAVHYEPVTANYMDKLLLMLGTRTAPDIVMLEAFWAPSLVAYDALMPLDKFVVQDPDFAIEDFEPGILNAFRFNRIMDETQTALQAIFLTDAPIEPALERLRRRIEGGRLPIYSGRASGDRPARSELSHGRAGPEGP